MVVTRDGRTVIAGDQEVLRVLTLDPATGELAARGCVARVATAGCQRAPAPFFNDLALTPDGRRLVVADLDSIRAYRLAADGTLTAGTGPGACVSRIRVAGCTLLPKQAREGSIGALASSPDGLWLYSTGERSLAVALSG